MQTNEFNLIKQADNYYELAIYCYNKIKIDNINEDLNVRNTCLFIQMCIELYMKGFVEILCGCDYKHTHEIIDNINIIRSNKDNIESYNKLEEVLDAVEDKAIRIKEFHTAAVYINGFVSSIREINTCFSIINNIQNFCKEVIFSSDKLNTEVTNLAEQAIEQYKKDEKGGLV